MYYELFQLNEPPFQLAPDPQFLFVSPQHARASAYMESTVLLGDGFVVLTGEIGCGKTTLVESFVSALPDDVLVVQITQTRVSPVEFLQILLVELGFEPFRMKKIELLTRLKNFLVEQYAHGRRVVLIIDEAQNLSRKVLEEVRLLSGMETQKEKVLRIILVGQPELQNKLDSDQLEQLTQRVRLRFHLTGLSKPETLAYIQHRLDVAGAGGRLIFTDEALDLVFLYTAGVPRLVNTLCDTAMLCAFAEDEPTVVGRFIETAVKELQWVPYADRASQGKSTLEPQSGQYERLEKGLAKLDAVLEEFQSPTNADNADNSTRQTDQHAPLARLDVLRRGERVSTIDLTLGHIAIGRTPDNDLHLDSSYMSRHHAQIMTFGENCVVQDLNSTNGTQVGANRIDSHPLTDGDLILLGDYALLYTDLRSRLDETPEPADDDPLERNRGRRDPRRVKHSRSEVEKQPKKRSRKRSRRKSRRK